MTDAVAQADNKLLERVVKEPIKKSDSKVKLMEFSTSMVDSQSLDLVKYLNKMVENCKDKAAQKSFELEMEGFRQLFFQFKASKGKTIEWEKIRPPAQDMVVPYADLAPCPDSKISSLANKLCVLKLNGGLGTTMGCSGPKSVIEVHSDLSFLDLTVHQIQHLNEAYKSDVPLILMNSFNTHEETGKVVSKYHNVNARIETFNQSRYPRILKDSLLPLGEDHIGHKDDWYPPGHGDVYRAFANSGLLEKMMAEGKEYVFISNIDNLGATVDWRILNWMSENKIDFIMEVTDKTRSDVKGGTLISYEGNAKLFEIAQCPSDKLDEFKSIKKFKIFNTNNLWVSLKAIDEFVKGEKMKFMDVIVNPKKARGKEVIQLETACGAAIEFFSNAKGVNVDRSRFLPVKSTSDLFVVQSNLYDLENAMLSMNQKRQYAQVPLVKLGDHFKTVGDYMSRFKNIPDILELDQLTVSGDVTFGSNVVLRGTVIIVANHGMRIDIPDGAVLENKVISGNLRILDH